MYKHSLPILIALCFAGILRAQDESYDTQSDVRTDPQIDTVMCTGTVAYPSYINLNQNHISLNGDDWSDLADAFSSADSMRVNIVHIGDSHLQADFSTAVTRRRLAQKYGSAGRGLIVPFRLAGTNQPVDYTIKTTSKMQWSRLLKKPWATPMGFTGISLQPLHAAFDFDITCNEPFDSIEILYLGGRLQEAIDTASAAVSSGSLKIGVAEASTMASLNLRTSGGSVIRGFNLLNGRKGVAYHVVGNNGATYGSYNAVTNFASDISHFHPALIIISLGTNEAFGEVSYDDFYQNISQMVSGLRRACPQAKLLLTTPAECQRKVVTRRRRKSKSRRYTSYIVNSNVDRMRNVILDFGKNEGIPVYDFYDVAGNTGSSYKWLSDKFLNKDRIHLTYAGYDLQGNLFTDALEEIIGNTIKIPLSHE